MAKAQCVTLTTEEGEALWAAAMAQKAERARLMPDDAACLCAMVAPWHRLKELGWREAIYAPKNTPLEVIEVGSTGIHEAERDEEGRFWITDGGDLWPSRPILFRTPPPPTDTETPQ